MIVVILLVFIVLLAILGVLPAFWASSTVDVNVPKLTEEWYKGVGNLAQLVIGFSFFTYLYSELQKAEKRRSLRKLLKRLTTSLNDLHLALDVMLTEREKADYVYIRKLALEIIAASRFLDRNYQTELLDNADCMLIISRTVDLGASLETLSRVCLASADHIPFSAEDRSKSLDTIKTLKNELKELVLQNSELEKQSIGSRINFLRRKG